MSKQIYTGITASIFWFAVVACVIALAMPQVSFAAKRDRVRDAFGVNIHLRQRITQGEWTEVMDKAQAAGVEWGREEFNWDVIESSEGSFSWDAYDAVVQEYQDHDIEMLGLLTYSSSWASSNPGATDDEFYPPDTDAWRNYVSAVATRYADSITYWEIWNEPNYSGFWKGTDQEYATLLEAAAEEITAVNPNAQIVLGGLSGADTDFLEAVYSNLTDTSIIDVVAIHPYRVIDGNYNYLPEQTYDGLNQLPTDIYNIRAVMKRHKQSATPVWLTEVGWTTYSDGVTQAEQAQYLMRLYTMALAIPKVEKIFWYTFTDTSDNESYLEAQFGLVNDDYTEKKSFSAYQFVKNNLQGRYIKNQTLPNADILDNFTTSRGWHFSGTTCTDGTVNDTYNGTLKISYTFTGEGNCYAPVILQKQLPARTRAIQFKVKGNNDDTSLRVRITDAAGETFQYNLGYMPNEWSYNTIQLKEYSSNWNGDGDGVLDYPLVFDSFIVDDTDGSQSSGVVYIDDLITSTRGNTYLYRFHKGNYDVFAYWSRTKKSVQQLSLSGVGRLREKRWNVSNRLRTSGTGSYQLRATKAMKFLQTL